MTHTEIWLRLMQSGELYGDEMVRIARRLISCPHVDAAILQQTGLSERQTGRFLTCPEKELEETLRWLEMPQHYFINADDKHYPPQLRAIADYPGAIFVAGSPESLSSFQLAVVGAGRIPGMANVGDAFLHRRLRPQG
jgi:DNA processing protein